MPQDSEDLLKELVVVNSPIAAFLDEHCVIGAEKRCYVDDAYAAYVQWCDRNHQHHPGTKAHFSCILKGPIPNLKSKKAKMPDGSRKRYFAGFCLSGAPLSIQQEDD